jgi:hypothetical protein
MNWGHTKILGILLNTLTIGHLKLYTLVVSKPKDKHDVETVVTWWLITPDTDDYKQGKETLIPRYDKYLNCSGKYVKKYTRTVIQLNLNYSYPS